MNQQKPKDLLTRLNELEAYFFFSKHKEEKGYGQTVRDARFLIERICNALKEES